jgi:hypothetical protein
MRVPETARYRKQGLMSPSRRRDTKTSTRGVRWLIAGGAVLLALIALCLLLRGPDTHDSVGRTKGTQPALDDIDKPSRDAMRDLLRKAGNEE